MGHGQPSGRRKLVESSDCPLMTQEDQCMRHRLRLEIMFGSKCTEYLDAGPVCPTVQIMGLELLQAAAQKAAYEEEDEDDYSYDSYANDSFQMQLSQNHLTGSMDVLKGGSITQQHATVTATATTVLPNISIMSLPLGATGSIHQRSMHRRMSNCGSIGETSSVTGGDFMEVYGYERPAPLQTKSFTSMDSLTLGSADQSHRLSVGSYAVDSVDYNRYKSTRRGSTGSNYAADSVGLDHGRYKSTRRRSMDSYAGDSVGQDYGRYKSTRRGSMDSYAGDSVGKDYGRYKSTRRGSLDSYASDSVGKDYGRCKSTQDVSMDSYAGDSVGQDYGRYKSTRRGSMDSYAGDSVGQDYGRYKSTRRGSMDSYAGDSVDQDYGRYKSTRRGSVGSYAGDSVDYGRYKSTRRGSAGSGQYGRQQSMESFDSTDYNLSKPMTPKFNPPRPPQRSSTGGAGFCLMPPPKPKTPADNTAFVMPRRGSTGAVPAIGPTVTGPRGMARRASTGAPPMAPVTAEQNPYGRYKSQRRGSAGGHFGLSRSPHSHSRSRGQRQQCRFSNMSDFAEDSVGDMKKNANLLGSASAHYPIKRRLSMESSGSGCLSFDDCVSLGGISINTGGASRAA